MLKYFVAAWLLIAGSTVLDVIWWNSARLAVDLLMLGGLIAVTALGWQMTHGEMQAARSRRKLREMIDSKRAGEE